MIERTQGMNGWDVVTRGLALTASLAALGAGPGHAGSEPHQAPNPARIVSQVSAAVAAAANSRDVALIGKHFAEDAVLMPPNAAIVRGRAGIEEFWKGLITGGLGEVFIASMGSGASGDVGYDAGTYHISMSPPGAAPVVDKGKYLTVLRRGKDGRWRITYDIWNSDPPAPQAPAK